MHLATPEPSSVAPCGDISPLIGITSTPVIDTAANRIYAVGAVSTSGTIHHELFALDLRSGLPVAGFPVNVDPPFPSGGTPVNQLQRPGLALDAGRILIGYGGNDGDCNSYWGWLVSAPTNPGAGITAFQVDGQPGHAEGAIWGSGNAPPVDAAGTVYVATGNGSGATSDPDFGDSVVKLTALASPLAGGHQRTGRRWTPPTPIWGRACPRSCQAPSYSSPARTAVATCSTARPLATSRRPAPRHRASARAGASAGLSMTLGTLPSTHRVTAV